MRSLPATVQCLRRKFAKQTTETNLASVHKAGRDDTLKRAGRRVVSACQEYAARRPTDRGIHPRRRSVSLASSESQISLQLQGSSNNERSIPLVPDKLRIGLLRSLHSHRRRECRTRSGVHRQTDKPTQSSIYSFKRSKESTIRGCHACGKIVTSC